MSSPNNVKNKKITISDVAAAAGVSLGTVDRVIYSRGRVSQETKRRVTAKIKELGYKPTKVAQILAKKKDYQIAVIYHNTETEFWNDVSKGIDSITDELQSIGAYVRKYILPSLNIKKQVEVIKQALSDKNDGIAIVPYCSPEINDLLNHAASSGIPVITFNNDEKCNRLCFVGQDLYQSGCVAGQLMSMMLPESATVAIITPISTGMTAFMRRIQGFKDTICKWKPNVHLIGPYDFQQDRDLVFKITKNLLISTPVDGIYVSNIYVEDVANAVESLGLSRQVKIIGHDLSTGIRKKLEDGTINATICQEPELQGRLAVQLLANYLVFAEKPQQEYFFTKLEIIISENLPK